MRVMRSVERHGLDITRAIFMQGRAPYRFMKPLRMSLFLSANEADVREAISLGFAAGHVVGRAAADDGDTDLRIAFDFDGVIADTEPLYDRYWNEAAERYGLGIPNFADLIKGTTLPDLMAKYFGDRSETFRQTVIQECLAFEEQMDFPLVPGVIDFIRLLRDNGVQTGLVTSSEDRKMERAYRLLGIRDLFDTVVTADRITRGKPDPMCYRLAAQDLNEKPANCLVFEDSLNGIRSATDAGSQVVGLSTSNPPEVLKPLTIAVIPDFEGLTIQDFDAWYDQGMIKA